MYMGHFGIALGARRWLRPLSLAWLLFAATLPDIILGIGGAFPSLHLAGISHTLPGVIGQAVIVALITVARFRDSRLALGAATLVLSHLAADCLTGNMLLWHGGPRIGLNLYAHPWGDFALETATILIGLALYARSSDLRRPARGWLIAMAW